MNRQTILASINRHLRDSRGEVEVLRPLSEIVSLVALDVRREPSTHHSHASVLPIWTVAAFIDGELSDDETQSVVDAVQFDNSVIAELIAAVLANEVAVTSPPAISDALATRLMALAPTRVDAETEPRNDSAVMAPPAILTRPELSNTEQARFGLNRWQIALAVAAAVALLLSIYLRPIKTMSPRTPDVAVTPRPHFDVDSQSDAIPVPEFSPQPSIDKQEVVRSAPIPPEPSDKTPTPNLTPAPKMASEQVVAMPKSTNVPSTIDSAPPVNNVTPKHLATPMTDIVWTNLYGVVAKQNTARNDSDYRTGEVWDSVAESTRSFASTGDRKSLRMITLPLSRAEASMGSGGRIVLAADTLVEMVADDPTASCVMDVQHGSIALIDVPHETIVVLRSQGVSIGKLRWNTDASIVISHTSQGLMVEIHNGSLNVDDAEFQDTALVLGPNIEPNTVAAAKRLPNWVDRPIDSIPVSKVILAQLSESPNVLAEIANRANALSAQPNKNRADAQTLATLAMWQAALVGHNVARLMNRTEPEIRSAAIQRLIEIPTWDPRYESIWAGVDRALDTPRQRFQIQQMCEQLRRGVGAEPAQIDLLLAGLAGESVARRGLSDYLLRGFYRGGPPFDPTWTGQSNLRAVGLWRRVTGR